MKITRKYLYEFTENILADYDNYKYNIYGELKKTFCGF